jgi:hypothetical protein
MDSLPLNLLKCSGASLSIIRFPFCDNGYHLSTYEVCQSRKREQYREAKGELIQRRHNRRLSRARRAKLRT